MPGHVTTEEAAGMIQMAAEGRTQREIAEETSRTLLTVNHTLRKATRQIAEYHSSCQTPQHESVLRKATRQIAEYHGRLEALAERAVIGIEAGKVQSANDAAMSLHRRY